MARKQIFFAKANRFVSTLSAGKCSLLIRCCTVLPDWMKALHCATDLFIFAQSLWKPTLLIWDRPFKFQILNFNFFLSSYDKSWTKINLKICNTYDDFLQLFKHQSNFFSWHWRQSFEGPWVQTPTVIWKRISWLWIKWAIGNDFKWDWKWK